MRATVIAMALLLGMGTWAQVEGRWMARAFLSPEDTVEFPTGMMEYEFRGSRFTMTVRGREGARTQEGGWRMVGGKLELDGEGGRTSDRVKFLGGDLLMWEVREHGGWYLFSLE